MTYLNLTHRIYIGFDFERPIKVWGYEFLKKTVELRFFHLTLKKVLLNRIWFVPSLLVGGAFFIGRLFLFKGNI